jgi:hypothetical protein
MLTRRKEKILVGALAVFAAARVAAFIPFPIFGPTDEAQHFDNVICYSRGEIPRDLGPHRRELAEWTPFFINPSYWFDQRQTPIPKARFEEHDATLVRGIRDGTIPNPPNHERLEPPLYYVIAGFWLRIGEAIGAREFELVYWVRSLNVAIVAAIVVVGYAAAAAGFPEETTVRIGTAALLATWPQDALYAVNNDALVPLCAGVAFLGIAKWCAGQWKPTTAAAVVSSSLVATLLTKVSAAPVVTVMAVAAIGLTLRNWRAAIPIGLGAAVVGLWLTWNKRTIGFWTGTAPKFDLLGFSLKPIGRWAASPLVTWRGASAFSTELVAKFWRGEMIWHNRQVGVYWMDRLYLLATILGLCGAAVRLVKDKNVARRTLVAIGACSLLASVFYLVVATLAIDFGPMRTPSPYYGFPGFVCGRLMDGAMIPFALTFAYTASTLRWRGLGAALLAAYCAVMVASEIWLHVPIFREIW